MNLIQTLEKEQLDKLSAGKDIPAFSPGDTVIVNVKVKEGDRTRVQAYEGVCIGRSGGGLNESFTVRKISYGEGVERVFPLYSPMIDSIKLVRKGKVRRAKLYYLRGRRGKSARIVEKQDKQVADKQAASRRVSAARITQACVHESVCWRRNSRELARRRPARPDGACRLRHAGRHLAAAAERQGRAGESADGAGRRALGGRARDLHAAHVTAEAALRRVSAAADDGLAAQDLARRGSPLVPAQQSRLRARARALPCATTRRSSTRSPCRPSKARHSRSRCATAASTSFVIAGIATEIGIEPTVRHGSDLGFVPVVVTDACGAGHAEAGERAIANMRFMGDAMLCTTDELKAAWAG